MNEEEQRYWILFSILSIIEEPFLEDKNIKKEFNKIKQKLNSLISEKFWELKKYKHADLLEIATFIFYLK